MGDYGILPGSMDEPVPFFSTGEESCKAWHFHNHTAPGFAWAVSRSCTRSCSFYLYADGQYTFDFWNDEPQNKQQQNFNVYHKQE